MHRLTLHTDRGMIDETTYRPTSDADLLDEVTSLLLTTGATYCRIHPPTGPAWIEWHPGAAEGRHR